MRSTSLQFLSLKLFKRDQRMRCTFEGHLKWTEYLRIGKLRQCRGSTIPIRLLIDGPILRAAISEVLRGIIENQGQCAGHAGEAVGERQGERINIKATVIIKNNLLASDWRAYLNNRWEYMIPSQNMGPFWVECWGGCQGMQHCYSDEYRWIWPQPCIRKHSFCVSWLSKAERIAEKGCGGDSSIGRDMQNR